MSYSYMGYLKTLLDPPDPDRVAQLESVTFGADHLAQWSAIDLPSAKEWQQIPVQRFRAGDAVRVEGIFEHVHRIDDLPGDTLAFWAPLSSLGWKNDRFPVDVTRYPIIEVTYRCTSENARPAWLWTYPGGYHFDRWEPSRDWRTIAHSIPIFDFPQRVDALIFRLYSPTRTKESIEIASVRFRAMSPVEAKACRRNNAALKRKPKPKRYAVLDEFLPLGVHMDAASARALAGILGITLDEYWDLALEDLVRHHHNCIALENIGALKPEEWRALVARGEDYGLKFVPIHPFSAEDTPDQRDLTETHVKPYLDSPSILAWNLGDGPSQETFGDLTKTKAFVEGIDPNHPATVLTEDPNAYPLLGRFFSASGIRCSASRAPWEIGDIAKTHAPLNQGQQFWMMGPAFVTATESPEWSNCAEMRLMVNLAFATGAKGWFSYTYHNEPIWVKGELQRSLTGPFLAFSDLWSELDSRMRRINAVAPLLLGAKPERSPQKWFITRSVARVNALRPEGVPPTGTYRLRGPDYSVYFVVSHDAREMATVNIHIPPKSLRGLGIYDLSDFVLGRKWAPMNLERHLEMFPGQARILLVAKPEVCAHWRDVITARLMEDDRRELTFNLRLAQKYNLNVGAIEAMMDQVRDGSSLENLQTIDRARDMLLNLIYESPAICDAPRSSEQASLDRGPICGDGSRAAVFFRVT